MIRPNSDIPPEGEEFYEERSEEEVLDAIDELFDKVWYNRHQELRELVESGAEDVEPRTWEQALAKAEEIEAKYGLENLGPWDDFEWGMLNGKLSALRWLIGFEWDMLDT